MDKYLLHTDVLNYIILNFDKITDDIKTLISDASYSSIISFIVLSSKLDNKKKEILKKLSNLITIIKIPSYLDYLDYLNIDDSIENLDLFLNKQLSENLEYKLINLDNINDFLNTKNNITPISFVNIDKQYKLLSSGMEKSIDKVMQSHQFILGSEIRKTENNLSNFTGSKHSILCASGSDALMLALLAIDVKKNDEVIVPALSFIATASIAELLGCKIKFADVDPKTYTISSKSCAHLISEKTVAIISVGLYGQPYEHDELQEIVDIYSNKYNKKIYIIEDAAQNFGANYKNRKSCNLADISTTSFFPAKPLGAYGDAGAIFTNDDNLNKKIRALSVHGQYERYVHEYVGINGRCDTIQAAIINEKLRVFPEELNARNNIAQKYNNLLQSLPITVPFIQQYNFSTFAQYSILVENSKIREDLINYLKNYDIPTAIHYPVALPEQPCFKHYKSDDLNVTTSIDISSRIMSLPMNAYLTDMQINFICDKIKDFFHHGEN